MLPGLSDNSKALNQLAIQLCFMEAGEFGRWQNKKMMVIKREKLI
jgi:hypothetical protein